MSTVRVDLRPHWIPAPFHYLFTRPAMEFGGTSVPLLWGANEVELPDGVDTVAVGFRYRGITGRLLGPATARVPAPHDIQLIEARLGVFNHEPFRVLHPS